MPLKKETVPDVSPDQTPLVAQARESVSQLPHRPVPLLEPKPIPATDSKQAILTLGSKHSSHHHCTYPGETVEENGKESMEETTGKMPMPFTIRLDFHYSPGAPGSLFTQHLQRW